MISHCLTGSSKNLRIKEEGNEHSSLNLKLVADHRVDREDVLRYENTPIQVYAPDGKCVYAGICTSIGFCCLNQYTELLIEAHSFSVLADVKPMERTFQDPSKKLGQIVDRVLGSYGYSVSVQEDVTVPFMLSQQNETDWAFIKRVANQLGFMVFADSHSAMKRISIGTVPFSSSSLPAESELQSLGKDISAFWQVKNGPAPGASAYEFLQEGYRSADLSFGAGYGITGGLSPQIVDQKRDHSNRRNPCTFVCAGLSGRCISGSSRRSGRRRADIFSGEQRSQSFGSNRSGQQLQCHQRKRPFCIRNKCSGGFQ